MTSEQTTAAWLVFGLIALLLVAGGQWSKIWSVISDSGSSGSTFNAAEYSKRLNTKTSATNPTTAGESRSLH